MYCIKHPDMILDTVGQCWKCNLENECIDSDYEAMRADLIPENLNEQSIKGE